MTIKEQLKDFLKTGILKGIPFGITREELTKLLGETDWQHFTTTKDKYPSIYKYGRLEFYFDNKSKDARLDGICFQPISFPAENGLHKCNYNKWNKNTDIEKAKEFLKTNGIEFEEKLDKWDKETKSLLTEGKVNIYFDCQQTPGLFLLHKAIRFLDEEI
jgi:hypothetical protein